MFIRRHEQRVVILIVYVDDIVITGNDTEEIANLKTLLSAEFEVKDLRRLRYFLGIEVVRSEQSIFISQRKYVLDLLKETGMLGCVPTNTPMEENHRIDEYGDGDHTNRMPRLARVFASRSRSATPGFSYQEWFHEGEEEEWPARANGPLGWPVLVRGAGGGLGGCQGGWRPGLKGVRNRGMKREGWAALQGKAGVLEACRPAAAMRE
ncbi:hypothetical protein KSP39_PZI017449 [Platanthera zijinensis]|uniref:Reverse transcriptase Ty1/copia-type domain-containing protein n=1 Tax=Platanthera zijinensis TaxID=2320716 RepID=A0AAP0FZL2_9ASPA